MLGHSTTQDNPTQGPNLNHNCKVLLPHDVTHHRVSGVDMWGPFTCSPQRRSLVKVQTSALSLGTETPYFNSNLINRIEILL